MLAGWDSERRDRLFEQEVVSAAWGRDFLGWAVRRMMSCRFVPGALLAPAVSAVPVAVDPPPLLLDLKTEIELVLATNRDIETAYLGRRTDEHGLRVAEDQFRSDLTISVGRDTGRSNEIEAAADRFLPTFRKVLAEKTEANLDKLKQAWLHALGQPPSSFGEKVGLCWTDLRLHNLAFDTRQRAVELISTTTLKDIRAAYDAVVLEATRVLSAIAPGALGGGNDRQPRGLPREQ